MSAHKQPPRCDGQDVERRWRVARAALATGNWPAKVFKPLPEAEAKLMREYGP